METVINTGTEPTLLTSLDYKLGDVASYVVARESISVAPMTGGAFGVVNPFMRFQIADSSALAFLDPGSVRLYVEMVNNSATEDIILVGHPELAIIRARLSIRGTLVEDLLFYGRTCALTRLMAPYIKTSNDNLEAQASNATTNALVTIPKNSRKRFCFPLKFGYFSSNYYHYFGFGAISIELQVGAQDYVVQTAPTTAWTLEQCQILCDVVRTTPDFADGFSQTLLSGGRLLSQMSSIQTMQFEISPNSGKDFSVTISRAFTRLKACYVTFMGSPSVDNTKGGAGDIKRFKEGNTFFHPARGDVTEDDKTDTLEMYAQLGTMTYPVLPMRGSQQMFYHLRRSLGMCKSGDMYIQTVTSYINSQFVTVFAFEKAQSAAGVDVASFSGVSTLSGEVLRIVVRNLPNADADATKSQRPTSLFVHLLHDEIVEHRGDGETVYV